jgi:4-hydroxy-tetrahydrodipicolinate synthase
MADLHARTYPFGTLVTAMVTPFKRDSSVDFDATAALANRLVDDGCDGLVISGTTGEASTLEDDEKEDLFRAVVEAVGGRAKVIAGSGSNHTSHSVEMSKRAEKAGVDGLLAVTPYYNKPSQAGVQAHIESIADATGLPVMIYDIPGRAGIAISTETLIRLSDHPRIIALKDAKADFAATTRVMANTDLDVYAGDDGLTLPWMAAGAVGLVSVSAHVATARYRALVDAALAGDFAAARVIHFELDPVVRAVMTHVQGAVSAKQILTWQNVLPNSVVRLPLVEPDEAEIATIKADLAEAGIEFA